jgi:glycosyltransferase involved in cell wall biosynthesis
MPVYNAADTLAFALASLQAQTYTNWECIVVDDGSTDNPKQIINSINDPRIQYHPLDRNYGRGYARQRAVEIANGKYLAFLDADDWVYPEKFRDQVQFLENQPDIVLVSTGMAISDMQYQLVGVRPSTGKDPIFFAPMKQPSMPPLAFPPTMMMTD